ncbi:MAG: hypothetical protein RIB45_06350 [Marivibrio sp.]|uniref:hypothetical protein n=1 Tax=Marivibrio sp. TaxID=2039719 RepID=UPI0032EC26FF
MTAAQTAARTSEGIRHITPAGVDGRGREPAPFDPADFHAAPATQSWGLAISDETLGLHVGVWTTDPMQEAFGPYPGDEFMLSLEGTTRLIDGDGAETTVRPGQVFCVHNAWPVSWRQDDPMAKFFMICEDPDPPADPPPAPGVVVYSPEDAPPGAAEREEEGPFGPRRILFETRSAAMAAGVDVAPAHQAVARQTTAHELWCVATGALSLVAEDGRRVRVEAGEAAFIPAGLRFESASEDGARIAFARCVRR